MTCTKKRSGKIFSLITVALIWLMTVAIVPGVLGATAVNLGSAGNYVILTKTGISTTGTTTITGNMGVSPIGSMAITGFGLIKDPSNQFSTSSLVTGKIYAANYASPTPSRLTTAVHNMETAYTSAAGQVPPNATELYAGNLGGRTLTPGVYKWSTGVLIPASTALTLDAQGHSNAVWVFQVARDLTMNSASSMVLINGAQAKNIFWQIGGGTGVTINAGSHAEGNILAAKAIVMKSGASINGRALAQTAVTLIADTITAPANITAIGRPNVTAIAPAGGPTAGGTRVTITGTGFTRATAVMFGTTPGTGRTVVSANKINITSPAHTAGIVYVRVITPGGTSAIGAGDRFTYAARPNVTAIAPASGPTAGGTRVTITGTGFTGATAVMFGATPGTGRTVVSANKINITSPAHTAGIVYVRVITPGGTSAIGAGDRFTYAARPNVTAIAPASGLTAGGTRVSVTGTGFTGATAVMFGATPGTGRTVVSANKINITSPAHTAGIVYVRVITPGGTSAISTADRFTYIL